MIKQLKKYDVQTTPFTATKSWELRNTDPQSLVIVESGSESPVGEDTPVALEFIDYDPDYAFGILSTLCNIALEQQENDPVVYEEGISGSGLFYPTDPQNINGSYKRLVYQQVLRAFYNNYRNPLKIFGIENIDFQTSGMYRYLNQEFKTFSLPIKNFGEKILEGSVTFVDNAFDDNYEVVDDTKGNLYAQPNLFSRVQEVRIFGNDIFDGTSSYVCPSPVTGVPNAPIELTASAIDYSSSFLNWTDTSDTELGFYIWRSEDSGSTWIYIGSTPTNVTSTYDYGLEQTSSYSYRVAAYNVFGSSSYSNTASITTPESASGMLYFPDGTSYLLGPYDTFQEYSVGSVPTNGGFGWESNWDIRTVGAPEMTTIIAIDDMSSYTSGSTVAGSGSTGEGWGGGYE